MLCHFAISIATPPWLSFHYHFLLAIISLFIIITFIFSLNAQHSADACPPLPIFHVCHYFCRRHAIDATPLFSPLPFTFFIIFISRLLMLSMPSAIFHCCFSIFSSLPLMPMPFRLFFAFFHTPFSAFFHFITPFLIAIIFTSHFIISLSFHSPPLFSPFSPFSFFAFAAFEPPDAMRFAAAIRASSSRRTCADAADCALRDAEARRASTRAIAPYAQVFFRFFFA